MSETPRREEEHVTVATLTAALRRWLDGEPLPRQLALALGLGLPAVLLVINLWRVHAFTIDDSFISYRYARNLTRGLGLVYNEGERIEGYTNFLFTLILAGGIKLGIDPEAFSKVLGGASALGSLGLTYSISGRLLPYRTAPCTATWLLATTIVFSGWSVFGLETGFFVFLILAGTSLFLRESEALLNPASGAESRPRAFPWSGVVFALAALTRPEAPLFIGLASLALAGRGFFARQNVVRGAVFTATVLAHLAFRRAYYGAWVPNTALAKTGNLDAQIRAGVAYLTHYSVHAGPVVYLALLGAALAVVARRRDLLAITLVALGVLGYVVLVGGDWMKMFRFMAPFEPFCFLLVDVGVRRAVDRRDAATSLALVFFAAFTYAQRTANLRDAQADFINNEKHFWDAAGGGTARWLLDNPRGTVALGDIGYVGWATDYPILDMLGLVDPVISKLPGGYTHKVGPGYLDRFFTEAAALLPAHLVQRGLPAPLRAGIAGDVQRSPLPPAVPARGEGAARRRLRVVRLPAQVTCRKRAGASLTSRGPWRRMRGCEPSPPRAGSSSPC